MELKDSTTAYIEMNKLFSGSSSIAVVVQKTNEGRVGFLTAVTLLRVLFEGSELGLGGRLLGLVVRGTVLVK